MKLSLLTLLALLTAINAATLHKSEKFPTSFRQEEERLNIAKRGINDFLDFEEGSKDFNRLMSEYADCYKVTLELFDNGKLNMDKFVDNREKLAQKMDKLKYIRDNEWVYRDEYRKSNESFEVNKFYDIYSSMISFLSSAVDGKAAEPHDRKVNETVERAMKVGLEMMKYFDYDGKPIESSNDWASKREEVEKEIVTLEKLFKRKQKKFDINIQKGWHMKTLMTQLFIKAEEKYTGMEELKREIQSYDVDRLRRQFNLWIRSFFNGVDFNQENFNSAVKRVKIMGEELERKIGEEAPEDLFHALKRSVDKLEEEQKKLKECTSETEKTIRETHVHILENILGFAGVYDLDGREPSHTVDWSYVYQQSYDDVLWTGWRIKNWEIAGMECEEITESLQILKRFYQEALINLS